MGAAFGTHFPKTKRGADWRGGRGRASPWGGPWEALPTRRARRPGAGEEGVSPGSQAPSGLSFLFPPPHPGRPDARWVGVRARPRAWRDCACAGPRRRRRLGRAGGRRWRGCVGGSNAPLRDAAFGKNWIRGATSSFTVSRFPLCGGRRDHKGLTHIFNPPPKRFESILEGLFGPGLLKDLSLFKDCEPEGVSDWTFNENCLFCCLRREKVKEHLVDLDEPALEAGGEALLRQGQAKIIRFERQAEEFLNAVFCRKDSPWVSDPNIPLVAREIMQRMIQQFAAEYTSKNSSTQDPSQPNSTKNQSLPKASPVITSPTAATTQNPVLSKLLMADQDSPLDLTVRKSQSEPSEQDGVLDLSTKKSPCAGSTSLSHSPGCSNTQGNGEDPGETVTIDSNNQPKSPLEKFMVRLCTHHQKQFIRVLNDLYTEVQPGTDGQRFPDSETMDLSTCSPGCGQLSTENQERGTICFDMKSPSTDLLVDRMTCQGSPCVTGSALKEPAEMKSLERKENSFTVIKKDSSELPTTKANSGGPKDGSTLGYLTASNSSSFNSHHVSKCPEGQTTGQERDVNIKKSEDEKDQIQSTALVEGFIAVKVANVNSTEDGDSCMVSQKNLFRALPEETWDSGFMGSSPRTADKENALQCSSKSSLHQDLEENEQDTRPKQENHLHMLGRNKAGYHLHPGDKGQFDNSKDVWLSPSPMPGLHKASIGHSRTKIISASIKTARKSKRTSGLRINDYDNQYDVVYISQPITECHFESQRSILSSRKTARKSTRGYFFNGDCCELPTVRTLARSSRNEDRSSYSAVHTEVLETPKQALTVSDTGPAGDVEILGEDPEESREERIPLKEVFQDPPSKNDSQESETYSATDDTEEQIETNQVSFLNPKEATSSDSPLSFDHKEKVPEDNSDAIVNGSPLHVEDQQQNELLGTNEVSVPLEMDNCIDHSPESVLEGNSDVIIASRPHSPETLNREESPVCSENEASPRNLNLDAPVDFKSVDGSESISTATKTENPQEQDENQHKQGEVTCTNENLDDIEGSEAAHDTSQLEKEEQSDDKQSSETEIGDQNIHEEENSDKKKKVKKTLVASDRCLRSQLSDTPIALQLPCLQIKVSKSPGAKRPKREVYPDGAASVHFPADCYDKTLLKNIGNTNTDEKDPEQKENEGNGVITRQNFRSVIVKEDRVAGGEETSSQSNSPTTTASQDPEIERLEICEQTNSDTKNGHLPAESSPCKEDPKQSEKESGGNPAKDLEEVVNEVDSENIKHSDALSSLCALSSDSRESASTTLKSSMKQKRLASPTYNLRHVHTVDPLDAAKSTAGKDVVEDHSGPEENQISDVEDSMELKDAETVVDDKPKFVEWCAEEENQELIADFNAQYMKVQKGWIQLEKEIQPTPKVKNKSDKLKEIWKSKKRSRKCKGSLEVQKLSPVQMLFMKTFKLSNICKWFLETTETRSLVIVKKLNTRLPGDVPPIKSPLQKASSSSQYPSSQQAERLKKHLKKFPGATPARNNWKTQKLWAKFRENVDKMESAETATVSLGSHSEANSEFKEERISQPSSNLPTPASTRILRKYSNIRGKLRAQQRSMKNQKTESSNDLTVENKQNRKSVCINPLMSPKLALQVNADGFPVKSSSAEGSKGKKGKLDSLPKAESQQSKRKKTNESSSLQEGTTSTSKDRSQVKKASKAKNLDLSSKASANKKRPSSDKTNKLSKKASLKEKKVKKATDKAAGKSHPPSRKGKDNTQKKPSQTQPPPREKLSKAPKQKVAAESPSRSQKTTHKKQSSAKTKNNRSSMKKTPESILTQRKRKLRAKLDCSHSKRRRLDAK